MSMLSGFGKSLVGGVRGFATGGIGGAITGVIGGMIGTSRQAPSPAAPFGTLPNPLTFGQGGIFGNTGPAIGGFFGVTGNQPRAGAACPRGYHLNKHPLGASKKHGAVPARSMCVRNRSMNPMNYRALTRSLRRVKRAGKIVAKLHHFNAPRHRALPRAVAVSENLRITSGNR